MSTQEKILQAARKLFSRKGFDRCTVDEIAERAGVNKASIYYHYRDKASLYERVLEKNLGLFLARVRKAVSKQETPAAKLEAFILTYGTNFQGNKVMANLMLWELASDGSHLTDPTRNILKLIIMEVDAILKEGHASGAFKEGKSFITYIIMVGSMNIFTSTRKMRKQFQDENNTYGFSLGQQEAAAEIADIVLNGVRIKGQEEHYGNNTSYTCH